MTRPFQLGDPRLPERFWSKVAKDPASDCWLWTASLRQGYGQFSVNRVPRPSHVLSYETFVGEVESGLVIDHLCHTRESGCLGGETCRHRACVNPAHLQATTQRRNILRGVSVSASNSLKEKCAHGHALNEENLEIDYKGRRVCRTCKRRRADEYRASRREEAKERTRAWLAAQDPEELRAKQRAWTAAYRARKRAGQQNP